MADGAAKPPAVAAARAVAKGEESQDKPSQQESESEAKAKGEADAKTDETSPPEETEIIELDAETSSPPGKAPARRAEKAESGENAPNPRVIVQRWQSGVSGAGRGLPQPTMAGVAGGPGHITSAADKANADRRQKTEGVPAEAVQNIAVQPKVPDPPPPPQSNPIGTQTAAILAASGHALSEADLPVLKKSAVHEVLPGGQKIGGNMPLLGDKVLPSRLFELVNTEGADKAAKIPESKDDPERQSLENARKLLSQPLESDAAKAQGPSAPLVDKGEQPITPMSPAKGTPVGQVVARLLASVGAATSDVLVRLRRAAYPQGVLVKHFPKIGEGLTEKFGARMNSELREIAAAAGVSGAELDTMVAERKKELEKQAADAQKAITTSNETATEGVSQTGQEALDAIEGARQLTDEEIIKRQEAATGGSDPEVINARRDLVTRWIRTHVTRQTTNYQKAGEKREKDLVEAQKQRTAAYNALAQREEYQGLHPDPPHDRSKPDVVRQLADFAAAVRADARDAVDKLGKAMRALFTTARDETRDHRAAVEKAGNEGIDAARLWAEDRILEGQSWWDRFKAQLGRWFGDSQKANEQWCVNRTQETRDGIAADLKYIEEVEKKAADGATKEQLLQDDKLTEEQRSVITEFFAQPKGTHPLDIAAAALRQRLAKQYLEAAKPVFEAELLAMPDGELLKVVEVAHIARPTFNCVQTATTVHAQLDNFDSDEAVMLKSLEGLSAFEGALLRRWYHAKFGVDMDWAMAQAFDSDEYGQAKLRLEGKGVEADATALDDAFGIINTDEKVIMDLLRGRSQEEIEKIRVEYKRRFGKDLDQALLDNLDKGNEQEQAKALMSGDTAAADAIEIDEAMRGGLLGWGTKEEDIEATYKRVKDDVLALAQREGWSSEQMKAEVRRRLGKIEADFNQRYKDVEQYNEPGLEGKSILRKAFASEMDPGPERDLANGMADDDMVKADAARIEIERRGVWASDEAINKVLTNQYERALQETRLDQGPARQTIINRRRAELMERKPPPTPNELSIEIMKLERELDKDAGEEAQRRSNISMEALNDAYQKKYFYPLSYTIDANMSGVALEKARALHKQGGRLTALQDVDYATKEYGDTDEDALRSRIGGMTKSEIDQLAVEWAKTHNGEDLRKVLESELSGRDASDILAMYDKGAPESAKERVAQEKDRVERELGPLTGVLGGAAAGKEASLLREELAFLEALSGDLDRRDLSDEERGLVQDQLDFRVELVQQGVEDHRRAIDSVANLAAQVAGLVVAAAITFVSAGTLGPVMIAVIASVAATAASMATKRLVQGGSYGAEDIYVDLAIGVVDALTSIATAGMGGKLLRGAAGVAEQEAVQGVKAGVTAGVKATRLTNAVGAVGKTKVMQAVGNSRLGQLASKAASGLNKMETGFLTKGMKGSKILARMAGPEQSKALQIIAKGLAEGIENAVSALPSSFAGTALNDKTWQGNPLLNLAAGTYEGVKGAVQLGAVMQAGHGLKGAAVKAHGDAAAHARLATPEGRRAEVNRIFNEAREQHLANNKDSTYQDFLASPEAHRAHAEVNERGLANDLRQLGKAVEPAAPKGPPPAAAEAKPHADVQPKAEPAPRPDKKPDSAQGPKSEGRPARGGEPGTHPDKTVDPATQALRDGLPPSMTDRVDVRVNTKLEGNEVQVIPDSKGPGRGVRVEVGPHATPTDVLLHAHTIQGMQRYKGLLGKLRRLNDWFHLTTVGTKGWEAKLELEKLPGIIHERMQRLAEGGLTPEAHARLVDEVNHLSRQIDAHQKVMDSPELRDQPGRGFVAAENSLPKSAAETDTATEAPPRSDLPDIKKKMEGLPPERRQAVEEHMSKLDEALRAGDPESFRNARDAIGEALEIPPEKVTEAIYLPRELKPSWDADSLTPQERSALEGKRFLLEKERRKELGKRVADIKSRLKKEPVIRELAEALARDLAIGKSDLIFNEMVEWIISKGRIVEGRVDALPAAERGPVRERIDELTRLHEEHGKSAEVKRIAEKLAGELGIDPDVLLQEILPGYTGRRPGAKRLVDLMRGMAKDRGVDLDGFVMHAALEENIGAIAAIRERLCAVEPDSIIAVERGGAFLADALAHGNPEIRARITSVPKAEDGSRSPNMEAAIRDQIVNGKKTKFVIVDFYMGGGAAGEFLKMAERILADHPQARFEIIWMREQHGFERHGDLETDPGVQLLPFHETPERLRGRVEQTPVNVRLVLGDDMAVVFGKSKTDAITIVDRHGRVVQTIPVGTPDPKTGEPLDARQIVIRLLNGVKFPEESR